MKPGAAQIAIRYGNGLIDVPDPYFQHLLIYSNRAIQSQKRALPGSISLTVMGVLFAQFVACVFSMARFESLPYGFEPFILAAVLCFHACIIFFALRAFLSYLLNDCIPPTQQVVLSAEGIRTIGLLALRFTKLSLRWDEITSVRLIQEKYSKVGSYPTCYVSINAASRRQPEPCIEFRDRFHRRMVLRLSCLRSVEERRVLVDMVKKYVRRQVQKDDLARILRANTDQDLAFTQLWSNALRSDKPRLNTLLLENSSLLQDGRFLIKEQIGGGGQGVVYLAEMLEGGNEPLTVALKEYVLPDVEHAVDRKRAIEQFEREVYLLARVKHDGIVKMIDAFVEDQRAYLVMEHVSGLSLRERVKCHGPLSEKELIETAKSLCAPLDYLHSITPEMVHLDVTPENVLTRGDGHLVMIDFNTSSDGSGLRTKLIAGKQRYMSPEQFRNEVSPLCDIYSLGCTLYYLATGVEPEPLTRCEIQTIRTDLPEWFTNMVASATELEKTKRIATVQEMQTALDRGAVAV